MHLSAGWAQDMQNHLRTDETLLSTSMYTFTFRLTRHRRFLNVSWKLNKTKLLESLAHQKNPHAEEIETNRRKTSNQTDPHKIVKILNTQIHPISSMTGFLNLKFCNLIHNSEYILSGS